MGWQSPALLFAALAGGVAAASDAQELHNVTGQDYWCFWCGFGSCWDTPYQCGDVCYSTGHNPCNNTAPSRGERIPGALLDVEGWPDSKVGPGVAPSAPLARQSEEWNLHSSNGTYLNCSIKIGAECRVATGHERSSCVFNPRSITDKTWPVDQGICACDPYWGFDVSVAEGNCSDPLARFRAECIVGPDACKGHSAITYLSSLCGLVNFFCAFLSILFGCKLTAQIANSKKGFELNAAGATLVLTICSDVFLSLWALTYIITPVSGNHTWTDNVMNIIGVPGSAFFFVCAVLNVPLMWLTVVKNSKSMKKQSGGLGNGLKYGLIGSSALFGILEMIAFVVLRNNGLGAQISMLAVVIMLPTYYLGSRKLSRLLDGAVAGKSKKKKSKPVQFIIDTANKCCAMLSIYLLAGIAFTLLDSSWTTWGQVALKNVVVFILVHCVVQGTGILLRYVAFNTRRARGVRVSSSSTASSSASSTGSSGGSDADDETVTKSVTKKS